MEGKEGVSHVGVSEVTYHCPQQVYEAGHGDKRLEGLLSAPASPLLSRRETATSLLPGLVVLGRKALLNQSRLRAWDEGRFPTCRQPILIPPWAQEAAMLLGSAVRGQLACPVPPHPQPTGILP